MALILRLEEVIVFIIDRFLFEKNGKTLNPKVQGFFVFFNGKLRKNTFLSRKYQLRKNLRKIFLIFAGKILTLVMMAIDE